MAHTFQELIEMIARKQAELKALKGSMKEIENDVPMELEDLMHTLKDLKKQVKELKDAHMKSILENNAEYVEAREMVQTLKEEIITSQVELVTMAANESREKGDLDKTVVVEGAPYRVQTQKEVQVYLNGKVMRSAA